MKTLSYLVLGGLVAVLVGFLILPNLTAAQEAKEEAKAEEPAFKYIGAAGCKFCHSKEKNGLIYEKWEASGHAKAFGTLSEEQQKDESCLGCHTTALGQALAAGVTPEKMQGVQCEACHGPGSEYKKMKVMKDRDLATKSGLITPTEEVCTGCHAAELPKACWKGAEAAPKFVFADAYKVIEHHVPKAEEKK